MPTTTLLTGVTEAAESIDVAVDAMTAWQAVSDVTRMGEWSPEATGAVLLDDGPLKEGTRFRGKNAIGGKKWTTTCTVVAVEPGRRFAFEVSALGPTARWTYEFEPIGGGTRITETWEDLRHGVRGRLAALIGWWVYGVRHRSSHNPATMQATLRALKTALEQAA